MKFRQLLVSLALGTVAFGAASAQQATPAQAPQQAGKPAARADSASRKSSKHHKAATSKMAAKDTTKAAPAKP